jgi:anti-sigma B factor antagonist
VTAGESRLGDDRDREFHLAVHAVDGGTVLVVSGDLDLASAPRLSWAVARLADEPGPVVLDLRDIAFVDSSGVSALLDVERLVEEKRRRLALLQPAGAVTRLLDLVELRARFHELDRLDAGELDQLTRRSR